MSKYQIYGRIKEEKSKGVLSMNKEELKEQVEDNQTELPPVEKLDEMENQEKLEVKEQTMNIEEETIPEENQTQSNNAQFVPIKEKKKKQKQKIEQMEEPKKKKKALKIGVILVTILLILLFFSTIFALCNMNNSKIASGVKIEGVEVSGLTKEEAKGKIETIYQEKQEKEISIRYQEYESSINPTLIESNYNIDKSIDEAMNYGKTDNIFLNNYQIIFALTGKVDIPVEMTLNEQAAKQTIEDIGTNLPGVVIESSYYREDNNLIVTKGKEGIKIDTDTLLTKIKERLADKKITDEYVEIPVIQKSPEPIDLDKIHNEIYKEAKDAYYTKDPFTVFEEVEGVDFNVEEAKKMLAAEDKQEYTIPLTITKPKITINDIGSEAFPDKLSSFTTRYDPGAKDRNTNLQLACQKLNNKVILAGETFSYNKTLGERTIAAGYKNAKVYENGQVVDGIGGGICQISSTLYNAVLLANLEITERRNHQFVTSYLPAGRDATVVYGMTDFKFKNTRKYPVKIKASVSGGVASIGIYGIKEENEYTFSFETRTISTIPTSTRYIEDPTLPVGTEKIKQKGANGLKTETYITKMLNGKIISKTLLSRDTYDAMQKIILKGTKGATGTNSNTKPVEQPSEPQAPTETPKNETSTPPPAEQNNTETQNTATENPQT